MRFQVRYEFFKRSFPLSDYGGDIPTAKKVALKFKELSDKMALQFDVRKGKASRHGSDGVQLSIYIYIYLGAQTPSFPHYIERYAYICTYILIVHLCFFQERNSWLQNNGVPDLKKRLVSQKQIEMLEHLCEGRIRPGLILL